VDPLVLEWLRTKVDPTGARSFHDRALRALAHAAVWHQRIDRQDGAQECLLWIFLHPDEFRDWSERDRSVGYLRRAFHNKITDAIRCQTGDRRTTVNGHRERVYDPDEIALTQLPRGDGGSFRRIGGEGDKASDNELLDRTLARWGLQAPSPEDLVIGDDVGVSALRSIPEPDLELLYRRHLDLAPLGDLAADLGISVSGVEKRLGRARARVHQSVTTAGVRIGRVPARLTG
jgi:DNA-directed RNA polymerase specialized sigma24 family protein